MTVFLDYYKKEREVEVLCILTEDGIFHDFKYDLESSTEYLTEPGFIVVYGLTRKPLEESFPNSPIIEEYQLRLRWLDVQAEIRKKTGLRPSLRNLLAATIGENQGRHIDIQRQEFTDWSSGAVLNRIAHSHDKLLALKAVYDHALLYGSMKFYYGGEMFDTEIEWIEPGHPASIEIYREGIERTRDI